MKSISAFSIRLSGLNSLRVLSSIASARFLLPLTGSPVLMDLPLRFPSLPFQLKGIISDRCEINRQIKADNAMLRELKAEIKKLAALVARTVPAVAEGLEKLRSPCADLLLSALSHLQWQISYSKISCVWKPELERYTGLVQQIKAKSKERKTLVAEKKELPIYHVKRHKALAVRIAELTEDLEEIAFRKGTPFAKI